MIMCYINVLLIIITTIIQVRHSKWLPFRQAAKDLF